MEQIREKRRAIAARLYTAGSGLSWEGYAAFYACELKTLDWAEFEGMEGVFMFAQATGKTMKVGMSCFPLHNPLWHAVYVGETEDIGRDLPAHPRWQEATALGATHVVLMSIKGEGYRRMHAWNWIASFQPPMNAGEQIPENPGGGIFAGMVV